MKKERDAKILKKDAKIDMLKKAMTQMSDKFMGMLQVTHPIREWSIGHT